MNILELKKSLFNEDRPDDWQDFREFLGDCPVKGDKITIHGIEIEFIESSPHKAKSTWIIFKADGLFYRINGTYDSWSGGETDWEDFYEVVPTPKTITTYPVKK